MTDYSKIRNFCIIAHIDHGKSTLSDRLLEKTGALTDREKTDQFMDKMELEQERGVTIKAQTARVEYKAKDGETYILNLIDTPGHVDFSYEVSRSLLACEGAVLVVDASQGIEAQTVAHLYNAVDAGLEIIPVLNKIDLPSAEPDRVKAEIEDVLGIDASEAVLASAKAGIGIEDILEAVVKLVPAPKGEKDAPLKALVFDSWYDAYQGVIVQVRVMDGTVKKGMEIEFMATGKKFLVDKVGVNSPFPEEVKELSVGEVGFITAAIKEVRDTKVGDTVTDASNPASEPLTGYKAVKPMVFSGLYPVDSGEYENLKEAMIKLSLNDASFTYEKETSLALGFGFRCGFLGLFHMEIIQERLEREYDLDLITTAPTVIYKVNIQGGEVKYVQNPSDLPDPQYLVSIEEPFIKASIHMPNEYLGAVMTLCESKRGKQIGIEYLSSDRVLLTYDLPLGEVVLDFYDKLKTLTKGYASMDYEESGYQKGDLVKLDIIINNEKVDALSLITPKEHAYYRGKNVVAKMKEVIPRQMFDVALQAAIGTRIISRETIKALRKNVTAKCYGGDISRKRKLLDKQKKGKKRMKQVGSVEIPQEAFLAVLKTGD